MFYIRIVHHNYSFPSLNSLQDIPVSESANKDSVIDTMRSMRNIIESVYQLVLIEKNIDGEIIEEHFSC
jgi:myosin-crossreactive antigen